MAVMGRPKNYSTKDIKNVIDMYILHTGMTVLLNASKIAAYAVNELKLTNFQYYVINRNIEAKQYVEDINKQIYESTGKKITSAVTIFTTIDIQLYQSMNKQELGHALMNLNVLMEDLVDSNTKLLKETLSLKNTVREKDIEIKKRDSLVNETVRDSVEEIERLKNEIKKQREIINTLKKSVKLSDDALHLLWDNEVEIVMQCTGVFENDGRKASPKRIITDVEENMALIANDENKFCLEKASEKVSLKFMEKLNKI